MRYSRANRWFLPSQIIRHRIDKGVLSWLTDQGSLTARLKDFCPGQFTVRVLDEQWVRPDPSEARLLNISRAQKVLLRQVHLLCGDRLCVYARSVIPLETLRRKHRRLLHLGNKPLGEYLFASPTLERSRVEWGKLVPGSRLHAIATARTQVSSQMVWGRRSLFRIDNKSLLVSEFFLPVLFESSVAHEQ